MTESPLTIAVLGAGAVGSYFAGLLARAGHNVHLLARGSHLDAIRDQGGLAIREPDGSTSVVAVSATDDPATLHGATYIIVTVKSYSLAEIAAPLKALTTEVGAVVIPLLNGVDVVDRLADLGVPRRALVGGIAYISAARTAPGVVSRFSNFRRIVVGELSGQPSDRTTRFVTACVEAGIEATTTDNIRLDLWRKFLFLAPIAAVCGLARSPIGAVRNAPFGSFVIQRAIREVADVARASGVPLTDHDESRSFHAIEELPVGMKPSFLLNVERGGPNELDVLSGTVARLGLSLGVDTPVHAAVVASLCAAAFEPPIGS